MYLPLFTAMCSTDRGQVFIENVAVFFFLSARERGKCLVFTNVSRYLTMSKILVLSLIKSCLSLSFDAKLFFLSI